VIPVVGIDPSLSATGVCTATGQLRTLKSQPDNGSVKDRADRIVDLADRVVDCLRDDVALVVIEGPAYAQQAQAGVHLRAGLWWQIVTHIHLARSAAQVVEVSPTTLKKFATGKGNATKPDMRMALYQRGGLDVRDDNQADAWWLRELGLHLLGDPDRLMLPKAHTVALDKVRWDR